MEVSRSNFLQVFPEVLQKLETAAFVSFDAEYTGLKGDDGETASLFDTMPQRYEILRKVVLNNSAPQFGLSIFQRMRGPEFSQKQHYTVDAYCFYLSEPCFAGFNMKNVKATVDIDCCQFLNGIHFNFDQWLKHSVPYLNQNKIMELNQYMEAHPNFLADCKRDCHLEEFNFLFGEQTNGKISGECKREILQKCRGFSAIVDVISRRQMPVVGHNMALDLMYFFHQFCKDLPREYEEFKAEVAKLLPVIYDTKYMTVRCRKNLDHPSLKHSKKDIEQLKCSGLYVIYKTSSAVVDKFSPTYTLSEGCVKFLEALEIGKAKDLEDEENSPLCHEPSFDACVTGIVFLNVAHMACRISENLRNADKAPLFQEVLKFIGHWQNQIFVSRASVMTMCLTGDDPRPNRSWVQIISGNDINVPQLFKELQSDPQFKKQLTGVDYQHVSSNEVVLAVSRVQSARELSEKLQGMGFQATNVLIPWDKKRYETVENCKTDYVYDTGRNKFLS